MPVLTNARHEKFIQNIIKGMTQRQAYKDAFGVNYDDNAIDVRASKLFNQDKIKIRYEELIKELEDKSIMSAKERMKWLTKVIKGEIKNRSYDSNGNIYDNEAYISDKLKSVDLLNKMDNTYQQNIKLSGNINNPFDGMSTEELRQILESLQND